MLSQDATITVKLLPTVLILVRRLTLPQLITGLLAYINLWGTPLKLTTMELAKTPIKYTLEEVGTDANESGHLQR